MRQGVRYSLLERGLYEALAGVATEVAWAHGAAPRKSGSLVVLRVIGPPSRLVASSGPIQPVVESAAVTVPAVLVPDTRLRLRVDGYDHVHDVADVDTPTTVRDAILASIVARNEDIEAAPVGSAQISLERTSDAGLWELDAETTGYALTVDDDVLAVEVVESETLDVHVLTAVELATIELQAYSRAKTLDGSAMDLLGRALSRLREPVRQEQLARCQLGIGAQLGRPRDASAIAGASWETRAVATIEVRCRAAYITPADRLNEVDETFEEAS